MNEELKLNALTLLDELKQELESLGRKELNPRDLLERQTVLIDHAWESLNILFGELSLLEPEGQLFFYKELYPVVKGWQLYSQGYFLSFGDLNFIGIKELRKYYQAELAALERFFLRHHFHYGYFSLKAVELDGLFFSGVGFLGSPLLPVLACDVPDGVPATAYLFALFQAQERLRGVLVGRLAALDEPSVALSSASVTKEGKLSRPFQWTGEVINLIELAHGLHLKGCVNDGETGVMDFFEGLGEFFGVNLGVPKRGFEDLKARKRLSKTYFIDSLREVLLKKMEESDSWRGR